METSPPSFVPSHIASTILSRRSCICKLKIFYIKLAYVLDWMEFEND